VHLAETTGLSLFFPSENVKKTEDGDGVNQNRKKPGIRIEKQ
jgi:hypothetical protein